LLRTQEPRANRRLLRTQEPRANRRLVHTQEPRASRRFACGREGWRVLGQNAEVTVPIVTPAEMGEIDAAAPEPVELLIGRAGAATARVARRMLGGTYGRRVVVVAGKGNNGNDGRDAATRLARQGVRVDVVDAADAPGRLPPCDLVVDAAYGTGFRGTWAAPDPGDAPVLAVDIPSGVDGLTGAADGPVLPATRTVSFAALKPGLVLEPGASLAGAVEVADIGLDVSRARAALVEEDDVRVWWPARSSTAHKWQSAVWVVGGSPGLEGAAVLTSSAATRAGAGYVRWSRPGEVPGAVKPVEVVGTELPATGWVDSVLTDTHRFGALVVGNGLGLDPAHAADVRRLVAECDRPLVVDADALTHLGTSAARIGRSSVVLTPHDGEYERLSGSRPVPDRIDAARRLAGTTGAIVLLKGRATVVAEPGGGVLVSRLGDERLATLGSGDVLAGVIGALCAQGLEPFRAAATAAALHGLASRLGWRRGLVAGDLVDLLPAAIDRLHGEP
jgi:NAD(P)H-hydrate epimerase